MFGAIVIQIRPFSGITGKRILDFNMGGNNDFDLIRCDFCVEIVVVSFSRAVLIYRKKPIGVILFYF